MNDYGEGCIRSPLGPSQVNDLMLQIERLKSEVTKLELELVSLKLKNKILQKTLQSEQDLRSAFHMLADRNRMRLEIKYNDTVSISDSNTWSMM